MSKLGALSVVIAAGMLSACTFMQHGQTSNGQRSGAVPGETITVSGNQNVYAIAQAHGVSMRDIIVLNNLHEPFALKSGQSLVLPYKRGDGSSGGVSMDSSGTMSGGSMQSAPVSTIESQELPPPTPTQKPSSKSSAISSVALAPVESLNAPSAPKPVATTLSLPPTQEPAAVTSTPPANVSSPTMIWPVQGPLLSAYGPKGQGVNNDGVNIGAPKGSPVVAAANGIVVYAGNEMKGFGNLVLVRHEGGWVTAYAYLDRVLVAKDAVVAQGDMIGTVGKSGNIATPQLHFETRHNGKAVDPNGVIK